MELSKRSILTNAMCAMCWEEDEDMEHLMIECKFAKEVWEKSYMGFRTRRPNEKLKVWIKNHTLENASWGSSNIEKLEYCFRHYGRRDAIAFLEIRR